MYFYEDDYKGGDTNNDEGATTPAPGDWAGLQVSYGDSYLELNNCRVRYAGSDSPSAGGFESGGNGVITNSRIESCINDGIYSTNGNGVVSNTFLLNNGRYGLNASAPANTLFNGNEILNNANHGVYIYSGEVIMTNNNFQNNGGYPVYAYSSAIFTSPLTGNTRTQVT
ncbi:MAG: right-handed parallel beta-helix repeat-containing protein [Bacteroidales bacterium]